VVDRRSVSLFVGLFVLGAVAGLLELLTDSDQTSTGATVAIANWVHVGLAVVLIVSLLVAYRRDRRWLVTFLVRPFTSEGWASLRSGLTGLPRLLVGRRPAGRVTLVLCAFVTAAVLMLVTVRAGEQVFAAFDPDFTRDAWGGPSYLGASLAHWLDAACIFYAGAAVLTRTRSE